MRKAGLNEAQIGIKIAGRNINICGRLISPLQEGPQTAGLRAALCPGCFSPG